MRLGAGRGPRRRSCSSSRSRREASVRVYFLWSAKVVSEWLGVSVWDATHASSQSLCGSSSSRASSSSSSSQSSRTAVADVLDVHTRDEVVYDAFVQHAQVFGGRGDVLRGLPRNPCYSFLTFDAGFRWFSLSHQFLV